MKMTLIALILFAICTACLASPLVPAVTNPGFEEGTSGWGWQVINAARVSYRSEAADPHSGAKCLVFTNLSGEAPHVYGRFARVVDVVPETEYELSVWVRGTEVEGREGINHFTDWNTYTLAIPSGTFDWQKRSVRFKTKSGQYYLTIGLNIANKCKALAIDDIEFRTVGEEFKGGGIDGMFVAPRSLVGHSAPGYLGVEVKSPKPGMVLQAVISSGDKKLLGKRTRLKAGQNRMEWDWNSGKVPFGQLDCRLTVLNAKGESVATAERKIEKIESPLSADLDKAEERFKEFEALYAKCSSRGVRLDYPTVARTTITQLLPLARLDIQRAHDWRARFAARDFLRSIDEGIAEMQAYLADPKLAPNAVRYQTGKVKIDGLSFIGDRKDSAGRKSRGPLFFCGHGHFGQVRTDMPRWPGYGVNIIQIEVGPSITFPSENEVSLTAARGIVKVLDDAAKHNVRVDVLLSPHYFPQWALNKWPHLSKGGGHFIGYCVDAPEAKQVIAKFLRTVVPLLKDKPALNSLCLSNEPVFNNTANCDNTISMWAGYLRKVHGDLATMNQRFGTNYSQFEEVPIPGNEAYDAPQFYDYCVFNQERFAAWHKWMADIIHEMAPNVPIHTKMMSMALPHRFTISWGCDPELFGQLSDINGNDCLIRGHAPGWSIPWHTQNMSYDLQRSLARKPVFNSENHPTDDRSTGYVPPEHFRTMLWQGAVHGQGATTIWVWERTFDPAHDFYGNVMDRPGCAQAVGTTCLDLNRYAGEVTALQNAKAPVAILFSIASITRDDKYLYTVQRAYEALNFCGVKVDFISEKQLAAGKGSQYGMIILPQVSHVLPSTFDAIGRLPETTRILILGDSLRNDPWGKPHPADALAKIRQRAFTIDFDAKQRDIQLSLLKELGAQSGISVVDASTGQPAWGVEWLPVQLNGRTIVNMVNLLERPVDVKILKNGNPVNATDLLIRVGDPTVGTLKPITPVLAETE